MKNTSNQYPEKILDLILLKDWKELNESEISFILKHINQEEYSRMRLVYTQAKKLKEEMIPDVIVSPLPNADLLRKMAALKPKPLIYRLSSFQIPLWQAAAMLIVVIGYMLSIQNTQKQNSGITLTKHPNQSYNQTSTRTVYIHDTIYAVLPVKVKPKTLTFSKHSPIKKTLSKQIITHTIGVEQIFLNDQNSFHTNTGSSLGEDTLTKTFRIVVL